MRLSAVPSALLGLAAASDMWQQQQQQLPTMLHIDWSRLPDPPPQGPSSSYHGFQDSDGGWVTDDTVITAFGYTGGGLAGFLNSSFMFNTSAPSAGWVELPPAPVFGRQEVGAALINGALYYVGGFSYAAPYTYRDVLRLGYTPDAKAWTWSVMPSLPYPLASMGVVAIGSKLFVFGGVDYDSKAFYVFSDRHGQNKGLGRRLLVLDTANTSAGWRRLPDLPGSPRWCHAFSNVGAKLYVIGGAVVNSSSVVDNWVFDTTAETWSRLPDLPTSSSNFQTNHQGVFKERYIILVGGYQFENVYNPNGTASRPYGTAHRLCPQNVTAAGCHVDCPASNTIPDMRYMGNSWASEYENDVFVFDVLTSTFGTVRATSSQEPALLPQGCGGYPINANLPQVNIRGNKIFAIGGECNDRILAGDHYTHYPRLAVVGEISIEGSEASKSIVV